MDTMSELIFEISTVQLRPNGGRRLSVIFAATRLGNILVEEGMRLRI